METTDALNILKIAWSGRKDAIDYPNFDDINEALDKIHQDLERLEKLEKAIGILKRGAEPIYIDEYDEPYKLECNFENITITQEEYELVKEVLEHLKTTKKTKNNITVSFL